MKKVTQKQTEKKKQNEKNSVQVGVKEHNIKKDG